MKPITVLPCCAWPNTSEREAQLRLIKYYQWLMKNVPVVLPDSAPLGRQGRHAAGGG
jgi:hypothetical protein